MCFSGLRHLVGEMVVRSSLVALVVTAQSEHSLHPTLTKVQGSHFFQSFSKISTPDQVLIQILHFFLFSANALLSVSSMFVCVCKGTKSQDPELTNTQEEL